MAIQPHPAPKPPAPEPKPEAAKTAQSTTIGMKPSDPKDPQAAKFEPQPAPPRWENPKDAANLRPDGPTAAETQRESSAKIEAEGMAKYIDSVDERPREERAHQRQVEGVAPPAKRS